MLVHRDNDDRSSETQSGKDSKPHLVVPSADAGADDCAAKAEQDDSPVEDGKTHLIGDALKSVYQRTLEEDIPDDFLDLLKQLK